ncbi:hypothetical protein RFI_05381 [Reticulomyxa filosa]|uniref:Uncharacterized protein n=1 Tax=Reticulomyxa filosa TaxID=46433 RepID=X6P0H8_RETFI|nr:hypothetical protein RFI_05381 [Reticulomyxa filosa]|eukprot:ETO31736.1 hypothetical protein RFI_05381 [Reticulomyxa filosa]
MKTLSKAHKRMSTHKILIGSVQSTDFFACHKINKKFIHQNVNIFNNFGIMTINKYFSTKQIQKTLRELDQGISSVISVSHMFANSEYIKNYSNIAFKKKDCIDGCWIRTRITAETIACANHTIYGTSQHNNIGACFTLSYHREFHSTFFKITNYLFILNYAKMLQPQALNVCKSLGDDTLEQLVITSEIAICVNCNIEMLSRWLICCY